MDSQKFKAVHVLQKLTFIALLKHNISKISPKVSNAAPAVRKSEIPYVVILPLSYKTVPVLLNLLIRCFELEEQTKTILRAFDAENGSLINFGHPLIPFGQSPSS